MFKRCTCSPPSDIMGRFAADDCPKHGDGGRDTTNRRGYSARGTYHPEHDRELAQSFPEQHRRDFASERPAIPDQ